MNSTEKLHWWFVCLEIWNGNCCGKCEVTVNATLQYISNSSIDQIKEGVKNKYNIPLKDIHIICISYLGQMTHKEFKGD